MAGSVSIFLGLAEIVFTLVVIFALYALTQVYFPNNRQSVRTLLHAGLFAGGVVYCTAWPVQLTPGVIADPRGALLMLAGLHAGPVVGGVTLAAGEVHRAILGGSGVYAGLVGNALATGVGLAGWWWRTKRMGTRRVSLSLLLASALGVTLTTMLAFLFIRPLATGLELLQSAGPSLALVQFGSVLLLGSLLRLDFEAAEARRQLRFHEDALDAHALVARIDRQGRVYHVNDNLRRLSGYGPADFSADLGRLFGANAAGEPALDPVWRTLLAGETWHGELHNTAGDGGRYAVSATVMPFVAPNDRVEFLVFVGTDITARVRAALTLAEAKDAAESASRSKSEFLANMSHELRTPLNAIMGFADILHQEVFGPLGHPRYREYARDISDAAGYLYSLITDILDISRIETSSITVQPDIVDLPDVAQSATRLLQQRAQRKDITLSAEIPAETPPVYADGGHVKQMLTNLLTNGVKYTQSGGRVWVDVAAVAPEHVVVCVQDTGQGIPPEKVDEIQRPFVQIHRTSGQSGEGVGLGLFLVKRLADLNDGDVDIESTPGYGTQVRLTLPRATPATSAASA